MNFRHRGPVYGIGRLRLGTVVVLGALLGMGQGLARADGADRVLSLDDTVRLALNNSPALLSAREDVNIALQRVRQAQSLFFPRLDLNANWSKFRVEDNTPLMLQPQLGYSLIHTGPQENFYTARANIYQPVYEGGRSQTLWRQARVSYERAKSTNEALQTSVSAGAKLAFYDLLFAREKRRMLTELVNKSEAQRDRASSGPAEQIRIENELSVLRGTRVQAAREEQMAQRAYLQAMNLELNTSVTLQGRLESHPVQLDLPKLLAWSTQYRSELRQTEYQQELDALGVGLSLAERRPTIGLGASYERTGTEVDLPVANWAGTLNINLPVSISDIVYGWAKVRERRALYRQASLKHAEVSDEVQRQVRQAFDTAILWQGELSPRQESYSRMESYLRALSKQKGRASESLEAERMVLESKMRYLEAVHGHLSALASLERAVGKPLGDVR